MPPSDSSRPQPNSFERPEQRPNVAPLPRTIYGQPSEPQSAPQPAVAPPSPPSNPAPYRDPSFQPQGSQYGPAPSVSAVPQQMSQPNIVPAAAAPAPHKEKGPRNWLKPVLFAIGAALVVAIGLLFLVLYNKAAPNRLFKDALTASLSSANYEVQSYANGLVSSVEYDLAGSSAPIVSTSGQVAINGATFTVSGYGTLQNTYIKYTQLGNATMATSLPSALNRWVQLRTDGKLATGINSDLVGISDPRNLLFGDMLFADYSQTRAGSLASSIISDGVFSYNTADVKEIVSGKQTYEEYPVRINLTALANWNRQIAAAYGLPSSAITAGVKAIASEKSATGDLYINTVTKQVTRLNLSEDGQTVELLYLDSNQVTLPAQPTDAETWATFAPLQDQLEKQAALAQSTSALDSERKSDIAVLQQYLEAYAATTGDYPSLANMNDQLWVSENMQGINPDVFKDPQGTSLLLVSTPTADAYAYQPLSANGQTCDNETGGQTGDVLCTSYKLTATLSNGQLYTVHNQN